MTLLGLIIALVILGLVLWLVNQLPLENWIKLTIRVLAIIVVLLWLLNAFGGGEFLNMRIGR